FPPNTRYERLRRAHLESSRRTGATEQRRYWATWLHRHGITPIPSVSSILGLNGNCRLPDTLLQFLWLNNLCVALETQNPFVHFLQIIQRHPHREPAIRPVLQLLAHMPLPAPHVVRSPRIKLDHHLMIFRPLEHPHAPAQLFVQIQPHWESESFTRGDT